MLEEERKLIKKATVGESEAFGLLYDYYLPKIYRFILIKVSHREEAEDLSHQVFLRAWQNIREYDDRGYPFSSWLYRIARNAVIDYYRQNKQLIGLSEARCQLAEETEAGDKTAVLIEFERALAALKQLNPIDQEVIVLRFIEEFSIAETAASVNKTEGAVKLIQHRALKRLKKILEKPEK